MKHLSMQRATLIENLLNGSGMEREIKYNGVFPRARDCRLNPLLRINASSYTCHPAPGLDQLRHS
eukprot:4049709-Amphidinium_carterae.6